MRFLIIFIALITFSNTIFAQEKSLRIIMIGNSTMANKPFGTGNPEKGWGQVLPLYFNKNIEVVNLAVNGRSTKSFIDEGKWDSALHALRPDDYIIIEFGHNDAKIEDPKRYAAARSAYKENLAKFIHESRALGGIPVLATPINRRKFDSTGVLIDTHGEYPEVVREIAKEFQVPLLDLHRKTANLFKIAGGEGTKKYFVWVSAGEYIMYPEGKKDDTHLNATGAFRVCDLAIEEIRENVPALIKFLNK